MSCFYCIHYKGLGSTCLHGHTVLTGSESFDCNEYKYTGEVYVNKSDTTRH